MTPHSKSEAKRLEALGAPVARTPEPWSVAPTHEGWHDHGRNVVIWNAAPSDTMGIDSEYVARLFAATSEESLNLRTSKVPFEVAEANATRIVTCVNAMAPNGPVAQLLAAAETVAQYERPNSSLLAAIAAVRALGVTNDQ